MSSASASRRPAISIPEVFTSLEAWIYSFLVISLSVFMMHGWGILWAACVLLFWGGIFAGSSKSLLPKIVLYLSMVCWPLGFVFFGPPLVSVPDSDDTGRCHVANEMRYIAMAAHNYESSFGHLPPAFKTDSNGRPMHSWRILLLPFLESESGKEVRRQYKMDQPWDSPQNLSAAKLLREPLFSDHSDPTMATEDNASPVLWTKPEDVTPQQVVAIFDANTNPDGLWKKLGGNRSNTYVRRSWFGMLDGRVERAYPLSDSTKLLDFCL